MGSPSIPAAPAAPDYAAANKEGIQTDISTLPTRRLIDAAAASGTKVTYKDVVTGEDKVADFTGLGEADRAKRAAEIMSEQNEIAQRRQLKLRQELGIANAKQTAAELRATDPAAYATRQALTGRVTDKLAGAADYASYVRTNPDLAEAFARERDENGGTLSIEEWGKRHYDTYGQDEGREMVRNGPQSDDIGLDTSNAAMAGRVRDMDGKVPDATQRMTDLYDKANAIDTGAQDNSVEALGAALDKAKADYALGSKLDSDTQREVTNDARAGQAARGNYLGDAAAVAEATTLGQAGEARRQQRLGNLLDVQSRVFSQTGALRNESRSAQQAKLAQMAGLAGQDFSQGNQTYANRMNNLQLEGNFNNLQLGENHSVNNTNYGRSQQALANASAMILGMPVTNQFGSLGAAANGTVGAPTGVNYSAGTGLNANAGKDAAGFASGNYGTASGNWNTSAGIAAQGNPWMSLLGNLAGAAAGSMGGSAGSALGKGMFG